MSVYLLILTILLRPFGPLAQASFGIGQRLLNIGTIPLLALSGAAAIIAGHNFGARNPYRVRKTFQAALMLGLICAPMLCAALQTAPGWACKWFSSDDRVVTGAVTFIRTTSLALIPTAIALTAFAVLSGLGNTTASLLTSVTHILLVVIPAGIASRFGTFTPGLIWAIIVGATLVEMTMALLFLRIAFNRTLVPLQTAT
jgi:Na+-driven multidrug efflux pump